MAKAKVLTHPRFYQQQITNASIDSLDLVQYEFQKRGINFMQEDLDSIFEFIYQKAEETLSK